MKTFLSLLLVVLTVLPPSAMAQVACSADRLATQITRRITNPDQPPTLPEPAPPGGKITSGNRSVTTRIPRTLAGSRTVFLELAAGFNLVSIPVRTSSQLVADLFPNLPEGAAVWTWNATSQQFEEGLDRELPFGQACWLYTPVPALVAVTGEPNSSSYVPVDLQPGWNLVGVPFENSLERPDQHVYVDNVKMTLDEAVAAGAIGKVFQHTGSLVSLGAEDVLRPLHGYWIYSNGSYLLTLRVRLLNGPWGDFFDQSLMGWGLKSLGSGIIGGLASYGITKLLTSLTGDPTADQLRRISQQLDELAKGQEQIKQSLVNLSNQLALSVEDIKVTVGDATYIGPVRQRLDAHYDAATPGLSYNWFKLQATPELAPKVTRAMKTDFAQKILSDWDFPSMFGNVKLAIMGSGSVPGVLDSFANKIVLSSNAYTLLDRYGAMQTYFAELITMQIKCGALIGEAYNQLAADPSTSPLHPAGQAADWYRDVFQPTIQAEYEYFAQVTERIAVSKLVLPRNLSAQSVTVPNEVQVMLGYADFFVMDALDQPGGMRVRLVVNPDVTPGGAWISRTTGPTELFATSATWRTVQGAQDYDSWGYANGKRQMRITNNWKVTAFTIQENRTNNKFSVYPVFRSDPVTVVNGSTTLLTYDGSYRPAASGKTFGSIMIANRAEAKQMLSPCTNPVQTSVVNNCFASTNPPATGGTMTPCDTLTVTRCLVGHVSEYVHVPFTYVGNEPKTSGFTSHAAWTSNCSHGSYRLQVLDGDTVFHEAWSDQADAWQNASALTWIPGHNYGFRLYIQGEATGSQCSYTLGYREAMLLFP